MQITGKTKIVGIFGYPIEHTFSPPMHNAAFNALGIDYCYIPFSVKPGTLATAVSSIRALNLKGVNITIPHKEKVIPYLDELDKEAEIAGAVNTIVNRDGKLIGYNTDGRGFFNSMKESGVTLDDKRIMVLGAGGAARAITLTAVAKNPKQLTIANRTQEKSVILAQQVMDVYQCTDVGAISLEDIESLYNFDILINATSLGMKEDDPFPVDPDLIHNRLTVCDIVPKVTPLSIEARKKGAKVVDGFGMLLHQGALSFELWTGLTPPLEVMRDALQSKVPQKVI
ncbi:MAG: shikimate dehydrogenase [Nitrospirota bacterium]